ncbi:MAG: hypothetical protein V4713_16650, partial [Pseudomonadota bacterium]
DGQTPLNIQLQAQNLARQIVPPLGVIAPPAAAIASALEALGAGTKAYIDNNGKLNLVNDTGGVAVFDKNGSGTWRLDDVQKFFTQGQLTEVATFKGVVNGLVTTEIVTSDAKVHVLTVSKTLDNIDREYADLTKSVLTGEIFKSYEGQCRAIDYKSDGAGGKISQQKDYVGDFDSEVASETDTHRYADGRELTVSTDADGTGTLVVKAANGVVEIDADIQRAGGMDGATGTVTEQVNGKAVVLSADFGTDANGAPTVSARGIQSIGGIAIASSAQLTAEDLIAFGFDFNAPQRQTIDALIAGLDPATNTANNWTAPELVVVNLPGNLVQRSLELGNGTTLSNIRTTSGQLVSTTEIEQLAGGNLLTTVRTPASEVISKTLTEYFYDDNGVSRIETVTTPSGTVRNAFDTDGILASSNPVVNGTSNLAQNLGNLTDFLSLIKAIQTGQPLPILASGLRVANDLTNLSGNVNLNLSGASNAVAGVLSILSLNAALERGDALGAITAGAQAINFGATAYANFMGAAGTETSSAVTQFFGADSALSQLGTALPYLSLVNSIVSGDPIGIASSALMFIPGGQPFAIALQVASLIFSLFEDQPEIPPPWGSGHFVWNGSGISTEATGETGGKEAVLNVMNSVLASMNALIERERQQNPGAALGIIPNRMPAIGEDTNGFRYTDIDPLTGAEKHPALRFDTSGRPYNADPGSPESFRSLTEGIVRSAIARGAIAPLWEVRTAKLQSDAGDPKAGLTEEERAGRDGQLAATITGTTQAFRPVMLDLDGDGLETTTRAAGVSFDVDDSGYLKKTAWLKADDGFLVLDRNLNGKTDSGKELFSNGTIALGRRGLAGMAWVDSNYDGRLTAADPVWNELKVWKDLNQNGVQEAGETQSLSALGVSELNYVMSTFTQNGVQKQ